MTEDQIARAMDLGDSGDLDMGLVAIAAVAEMLEPRDTRAVTAEMVRQVVGEGEG